TVVPVPGGWLRVRRAQRGRARARYLRDHHKRVVPFTAEVDGYEPRVDRREPTIRDLNLTSPSRSGSGTGPSASGRPEQTKPDQTRPDHLSDRRRSTVVPVPGVWLRVRRAQRGRARPPLAERSPV